jgi:hypothetical protein
MIPFKIVWLNGMPRSGTNWLSNIFNSNEEVNLKLAPLFSFAFKNSVNKHSTKAEWEDFFERVYHSDDEFINQRKKQSEGLIPVFPEKSPSPRYLAIKDTRHHNLTPVLLEMFEEIRFIHIVRNPCATIYSWLASSKEFPKGADPMKEWRTGDCRKTSEDEFWGFNDWVRLTRMYRALQARYPGKVMVVSYDLMVDDLAGQTQRMFDFAGLKAGGQTEKFLKLSQSSHMEHENSVFKDKQVKDRWVNNLDPLIIDTITRELKDTELDIYLK